MHPMFITALFTITKTWKQPKCLSTDKWIKIWCVYIYIYIYTYTCTHTPIVKHFSVKKKGWNIFICDRMLQNLLISKEFFVGHSSYDTNPGLYYDMGNQDSLSRVIWIVALITVPCGYWPHSSLKIQSVGVLCIV